MATRSGPKDEKEFKPQDFEIDSDFDLKGYCMIDFIITHDIKSKKTIKFLPKYIRINDCQFGEPQFMKLRSPMVARFHKFSKVKTPHEFYYSELQLYRPFASEDELSNNSLEICKSLYHETSAFNGDT